MKVRELIEELKKCDPEYMVVLSMDEEGNGFGELKEIDRHSKFDGEDIGLAELTPELEDQGYGEEDVMDDTDAKDVVVLWPW